MGDADILNEQLASALPAAWRCLSPLGRAAAFPRGIPFQADEARDCTVNATIGQLTDGRGNPLPLPGVAGSMDGVDPRRAFLYAPIDGPEDVRRAWGERERRLAGGPDVPTSLPIVTHGLTHSLSLLADLFVDPETDVVVAAPSWGNYKLIFGMHAQARIVAFPFFRGGRFNVEGLVAGLASIRSKGVLVLNLPGNPTGYQPTSDEVAQIVAAVRSHQGPLVIAVDDAYQGWIYEEGRHQRSIFWDLCEGVDLDRHLPVKVDGATKELVFFSSRVAFLTHPSAGEEADAALRSKLKFLIRGTVGSASGPALGLVQRALASPDLESAFAERKALLAKRWNTLRAGLATLDEARVRVHPFNGAFFALMTLDRSLDAEAVRRRLLEEHSVGVIAFPQFNAIRVAYCSIHDEDLPELTSALHAVLDAS
ncbi:MAG: aminotransferase class I/II-fold pyridoxal phosphate-dependent enzyme [Myxococcales bacterium]|nr:aminotransferase class I/II-fold pyridoxal phosphate-dependent enzyme [Myxococcales bacterium]